MKYRAKLFKREEFLGLGFAEIEGDWLRLRFDPEEVAFISVNISEAIFHEKLFLDGLSRGIKNGESQFEIPQYSAHVQLIPISDYN